MAGKKGRKEHIYVMLNWALVKLFYMTPAERSAEIGYEVSGIRQSRVI